MTWSSIIVDGGSAASVITYASLVATPDVLFEGIEFRSSYATAGIAAGRGGLRFIDCALIQSAAGPCIVGTAGVAGVGTDELRFENCLISAPLAQYALALIGVRLVMDHCSARGEFWWMGSESTIEASYFEATVGAGEAAVKLFGGLVNVHTYRFIGNHIKQNGVGGGLQVGGGATSDEYVIDANLIKGASSGTAIAVAGGDRAVISGNYIRDWSVGISASGGVTGFPNHYQNVTTPWSGTGVFEATEARAHGLVAGSGSGFTAPAEGSMIVGDGAGGWTTIIIGGSGTILRSDGSTPSWASPSGVAVVSGRWYVSFGSIPVGGESYTP